MLYYYNYFIRKLTDQYYNQPNVYHVRSLLQLTFSKPMILLIKRSRWCRVDNPIYFSIKYLSVRVLSKIQNVNEIKNIFSIKKPFTFEPLIHLIFSIGLVTHQTALITKYILIDINNFM